MKILVITALSKEQNALIARISTKKSAQFLKGFFIDSFFLKNQYSEHLIEVGIMNLNAVGNVEAAIKTSYAIFYFSPDIIFLSGICGGFKNGVEVHLGDIVIPDEIIYYEYGKIKNGNLARKYLRIGIDTLFLSHVKKINLSSFEIKIKSFPSLLGNNSMPKIHFAPIASGEKVIADEEIQLEFKKYCTKLIGVEMESYGVAKAVLNSEKPIKFLVVKSIADWADTHKNDEWHEFATEIAAEFVISLIKYLDFDLILSKDNTE